MSFLIRFFYGPYLCDEIQKKKVVLRLVTLFWMLLVDRINDVEKNVVNLTIPKSIFRTIANYLAWRMTEDSISFMTTALRDRQLKYLSAINGQEKKESRWSECIKIVQSNLEVALSAMYVRKHFNQDAKRNALNMVSTIKKEFEGILKTVPWMGGKTREAALEKVKKMYTNIGHPDELMDDKKLIDFHVTINIDQEKYLESSLSVQKFKTYREFHMLPEPVNKTDWVRQSKQIQVNAFYSPIENSISKSHRL